MKTLGWVVAIGIVLYLIGRSRSAKKPGEPAAPGLNTPAGNLTAQTTNLANTAGELIYKIASNFASQTNSDLVDQQPIYQNDLMPADFMKIQPYEEKLAGISPEIQPKEIPRAEFKWYPGVMYIERPPWNETLCG